MSMNQPMMPQQQSEPQTDMLEMTEQHIAVVVNQVLTLMSSSMQGAKSAFDAEKSLTPLVAAFTALHGGMVSSRQARATQTDPQAELQLKKEEMQHKFALDLMQQQHEEQLAKQKMEFEQHIAGMKAKAEEERAGLQNAQIATQIQQQAQTHSQQQAQQQEQHNQSLSNEHEMHQVQVQQAKDKSTESVSEN